MLTKKKTRVFSLAAISATIVALAWPDIKYYRSTSAFIHVEAVDIRSARDGIVRNLQIKPFDRVGVGQNLFSITKSNGAVEKIARLELDVALTLNKLAEVQQHLERVNHITETEENRVKIYAELYGQHLRAQLSEAEAYAEKISNDINQAELEKQYYETVHNRVGQSGIRRISAESAVASAASELEAQRGKIEQIEIELRSIEGNQGVPQTLRQTDHRNQNLTQLVINTELLEREKRTLERDLENMMELLSTVALTFEERFEVSPVNGFVSETHIANSGFVLPNTAVITISNCDDTLVVATFSESYGEEITPGMSASVRLRKGNERYGATVLATFGMNTKNFLSSVGDRDRDEVNGLKVILRLERTSQVEEDMQKYFCFSGRNVDVSIRKRQ